MTLQMTGSITPVSLKHSELVAVLVELSFVAPVTRWYFLAVARRIEVEPEDIIQPSTSGLRET